MIRCVWTSIRPCAKKYFVKVTERWHERKVEPVIESDTMKILLDICVKGKTNRTLKARYGSYGEGNKKNEWWLILHARFGNGKFDNFYYFFFWNH